MYKLIIVEDEDIIRRGLVHTIDWISLGFTVIGEGRNGKIGLTLIEEFLPDLIITDIRMPEMDGLEMISKGKEIRDFESIILTSYGEFDYAKRAIELGVSNYLLKPIDENILIEKIIKVRSKIKEKKTLDNIKELIKEKEEVKIFNSNVFVDNKDFNPNVMYSLEKIKRYYNDRISIEAIAEELNMSHSYLSRTFKKETGFTFLDMLNRYRVQKAIEIMTKKKERFKVYEIADLVGFYDYKHFCLVFKKYTKMAPKDFIKAKSVVIK